MYIMHFNPLRLLLHPLYMCGWQKWKYHFHCVFFNTIENNGNSATTLNTTSTCML